MHQGLLAIVLSAWAVAATVQGQPVEEWCNYRIPPGFVYEGEPLTLEQAREIGDGSRLFSERRRLR
jgi:hypothetical protein